MQFRGYGAKGGKSWIINEAHGLRNDQVRKLLTLLEPEGGLPAWVVFIFTTTKEGANLLFEGCDDTSPLLSRCFPLNLVSRDMAPAFAASVVAKARSIGLLNGKGDDYYIARAVTFLKREGNNCRALWQAVDAGYLTDADHD
jgi:hypothetical protein